MLPPPTSRPCLIPLSIETSAFGSDEQFTQQSFQRLTGAVHYGAHAYFKPSGFIQLLLPNPFHPLKVCTAHVITRCRHLRVTLLFSASTFSSSGQLHRRPSVVS